MVIKTRVIAETSRVISIETVTDDDINHINDINDNDNDGCSEHIRNVFVLTFVH